MTPRLAILFALFFVTAAGCEKKKAAPEQAEPAPGSATTPQATAPADEPVKPQIPMTDEARREHGLAFVQQLQSEAGARPKVTPMAVVSLVGRDMDDEKRKVTNMFEQL